MEDLIKRKRAEMEETKPSLWSRVKRGLWKALPFVGVGAAAGTVCYAVGYHNGQNDAFAEMQDEQDQTASSDPYSY